MTCAYCHRHHDPRVLCQGVSRRAFFFFGAAAGVVAFTPTILIPSTTAVLQINGVDLSDHVRDIHVDQMLTEISVAYSRGESFVSDVMTPVHGRGEIVGRVWRR